MRETGILLPITSLPSAYGIGCFSIEAYEFVDKLKKAGQNYWQILPLGPTSYGDSPYQSFSAYAGNPYFIDLGSLVAEGLLMKEECDSVDFGSDSRYVDYEKIYLGRFSLLRKAYERSNFLEQEDARRFLEENAFWLDDYALYMAVKNHFDSKSLAEWDDDIRLRQPEAVDRYFHELVDDVNFYKYLQYEFIKQWSRLKDYANKNGIRIIGDIPIYVAFDSADTWANPQLFQFDENNMPTAVAGCPPDAFAATGQLWGNPLYKWDYHKETGFEWWLKRIEYSFRLYDVVRIDHFRGFDEYYSIPFGDPTAEFGHWEKGPGYELFRTVKEKLGDLDIIAEDLGYVTDTVRQLLSDCGYPGMKILQFAFDSREESDYSPHNYSQNCVVYTGTHDNDTLVGWMSQLCDEDKKLAVDYLNLSDKKFMDCRWEFIRSALGSVANIAIIPIQDYIGVGTEGRINVPSTLGDNWKWRMKNEDLSEELLEEIKRINQIYKRGM
ncbi:MAG: 4-alpha-glucanotransferase [Lachnospiraceae bacterium]|nr:4-alpha-glucanotransferase [Lachnospiraceae bacterium]